MCVRWARRPSSASIVASVVFQLPGRPRLLQWMWTGCGRPRSIAVWASSTMSWRGGGGGGLRGGVARLEEEGAGRDVEVGHGRVEVVDVAGAALPLLDAAGVD